MVHWAWLIIAFAVGGIVGFFLLSLMTSSKMGEEAGEKSWNEYKNKNGFTLIELMISMAIAMLLLGGLVNFFVNQSRSYASNEITLSTLQDARSSVSTMVMDLRLAGYKPSSSSFCGIAIATDKTIQVLSDLNQDGNTSGTDEDITYVWIPGTNQLTKNGTIFLDNVSSLTFQYMLQDGSVTSTPSDLTQIRKVTMSISVQSRNVDPLTMNPKIFSLTSDVTPRNLGL